MENILLKKNINDYSLYIFDLDGTLYYQKPFRIRMALYLMTYIIRHPFAIKDIFIIKRYREIREKWEEICSDEGIDGLHNTETLDDMQYSYVAKKMSVSTERVKNAVEFFMMKAPLSLLPKYADAVLKNYIAKLKAEEKKVVIYSDYPVKDKLDALDIVADGMYTSGDERIDAMKPSPVGINVILSDYNCNHENAVMIGDRYEKDALCAIANDVDYVILSSAKEKRANIYKEIGI